MIIEVNRIPFHPSLLKGNWGGIVYSIQTEDGTLEEHFKVVEDEVCKIISNYDSTHHYSISLREVKRELVYQFNDYLTTFVQFRIRDSY